MNIVKLTAALTLSAALMTYVMPTAALAADDTNQQQKLEQELKLNCTTGAYGQSSTCTAEGRQRGEQRQVLGRRIVLADGRVITTHEVADTGLDGMTSMVALGTLASGAGALALRKKLGV